MIRTLCFARHLSVFLALLAFTQPAQAQTGYGVTANGTLFRFDVDSPATVTTIGNMGIVPEGIDFRPLSAADVGNAPILYAIDIGTTTTQLYKVNTLTAAVTPVGAGFATVDAAYNLTGTTVGFDFNPRTLQADNSIRIRLAASSGVNLRLNSDTGLIAAVDVPLQFAAGDVNTGVGSVDAVAYINNNLATAAAAGTTALYGMDARNDDLLIINPPNNGTLNTVGPFGATIDALTNMGFDIYTDPASTDNTITGDRGLAVLRRPEASQYLLYDVNLATGQITNGRAVGGGIDFTGGFAVAPAAVPEPSTLVLMLGAGLPMLAIRKRRQAG
jgi:hypothetical protein